MSSVIQAQSQESLQHRSHERLLHYWDQLRAGRLFPHEREIESDDIQDIWNSCFLISVDDVTRRIGYRYSYMGSNLVKAFGDEETSPDVALRLLSTQLVPNSNKMDEVIKQKHPVVDESEFVNAKHMQVRYRTCMVPLGYDNGEVSHIFGVMRWRAY
jgi:hypothetical protein